MYFLKSMVLKQKYVRKLFLNVTFKRWILSRQICNSNLGWKGNREKSSYFSTMLWLTWLGRWYAKVYNFSLHAIKEREQRNGENQVTRNPLSEHEIWLFSSEKMEIFTLTLTVKLLFSLKFLVDFINYLSTIISFVKLLSFQLLAILKQLWIILFVLKF